VGRSSEKRPADVGRSSEKRPADALCLDYRPKKLARSARLSAALKDYGKLLEDFELADVTFAVRHVQVGQRHERGRGVCSWARHCDQGGECGGVPRVASVSV